MKREEGYYWVFLNGRWVVAQYTDSEWYIAGIERIYDIYEFDIIDERRIINPNEK